MKLSEGVQGVLRYWNEILRFAVMLGSSLIGSLLEN